MGVILGAALFQSAYVGAEEAGGSKLETMTVTATRTEKSIVDVPVSISVQDMSALLVNGFTYGTDEFRGVPGVSFRRGEGDGDAFPFVSFRGSPGTDGYLALIDGIPFVGVFEEAPLDQIPYNAVERVEVVKGPGSTLYGRGAVYGLSNYITRRADRDENSVSISTGSNGYYRGQGSVMRQFSNGGGYLLDATVEDYEGWREQSSRERFNLFAKLELPVTDATAITAYFNYLDAEKQIPNGIPLDGEGKVLPVAGGREAFLGFGSPNDDQTSLMATIKVDHEVSADLATSVALQVRRTERENALNFYDPFGFAPERNVYSVNGFRSDKEQDAAILDANIVWTTGRHNLVAGMSVDHARSDTLDMWSGQNGFSEECGFSFFLIEVDYSTGEVINRDHPCFVVDLPFSDNDVENTAWGIFVQDEIALTEAITATLGLRYDAFEREVSFDPVAGSNASGELSGDTDAFSPRFALAWHYSAGQVYFSYGRGFNSNFGPIFEWNPANYARPENKPTTIDSYEIGWKVASSDNRFSAELAAFQTLQKDRRSTVPNPAAEDDFSQPSNLITYGQRYQSQGLELSFSYQLAADTRFSLAASHIEPEWDEYIINSFGNEFDLSGTTPVGVAENTLYTALSHRVTPWLELRAIYEHYDDYQVTQDNSVEAGQYELLTLGATLSPSWWPNAAIVLTATNALDEEYYFYFGNRTTPTYATPGPEREIRATLEVAW